MTFVKDRSSRRRAMLISAETDARGSRMQRERPQFDSALQMEKGRLAAAFSIPRRTASRGAADQSGPFSHGSQI